MVDRVIEQREVESPRDTVVVRDRDDATGSNTTGIVIAVIVLILLALLLFGRGMFGGGGGGGGSAPTDVNIKAPSAPTTGQ